MFDQLRRALAGQLTPEEREYTRAFCWAASFGLTVREIEDTLRANDPLTAWGHLFCGDMPQLLERLPSPIEQQAFRDGAAAWEAYYEYCQRSGYDGWGMFIFPGYVPDPPGWVPDAWREMET